MRPAFASASLILLASCAVFAQSSQPAFEVASIKQAAPQPAGQIAVRMGGDAGRVDYANVSLKEVLTRAYGVKASQIAGPSWLDSDRFDITAKVPEGVPTTQVPAMLQSLLSERFKMTVHKESKEEQVFGLTAAKGGHKLKKSEESEGATGPPITAPNGGRINAGGGRGGMMVMAGGGGNARIQSNGVTMAQFADTLSRLLNRPVLDSTGIEGRYDIAMDVSMEELAGLRGGPVMRAGGGGDGGGRGGDGPAPEGAPTSSIFSAVQLLGLKLEARKAPVERVFVDKAERVPTEN